MDAPTQPLGSGPCLRVRAWSLQDGTADTREGERQGGSRGSGRVHRIPYPWLQIAFCFPLCCMLHSCMDWRMEKGKVPLTEFPSMWSGHDGVMNHCAGNGSFCVATSWEGTIG